MELYQQLKPLVFSLWLFGLFFDFSAEETASLDAKGWQDAREETHDKRRRWTRSKGRVAHVVYCACVCSLLWLRALTIIPSFWVGVDFRPDLTSSRVIWLMWSLQCSLNASVILNGCREKNTFRAFTDIWRTLQTNTSPTTESGQQGGNSEDTIYADIASSYCCKVAETGIRQIPDQASRDDRSSNALRIRTGNKCPKTTSSNEVVDGSIAQYCHSRPTSESKKQLHSQKNGTSLNCARDSHHKSKSGIGRSDLTPVESGSKNHSSFDENQVCGDGSHPNPDGEDLADSRFDVNAEIIGSEIKETHHTPRRRSRSEYEKIGVKYAAISWCYLLLNCALMGLFMFGDVLPESEEMTVSMTNPFGTLLPVMVVLYAVIVFEMGAWVFPAIFCCGLCSLLCTRFRELTKSITTGLSQTNDRFPTSMECWRQEHLRLCQCVTVLDETLGRVLMTCYVTNLPMMVFLLYVMTVGGVDVARMLTFGSWLLISGAKHSGHLCTGRLRPRSGECFHR